MIWRGLFFSWGPKWQQIEWVDWIFFSSWLNNNQLTGSIPPQISALTVLEPSSVVRFSYVHWSVFAISRLFFPSWGFGNHLTGVFPSSALEITELYGPAACFFEHWQSLLSVSMVIGADMQAFQHFSFDDCWVECLLTHDFKRSAFIYRGLAGNKLDGTIPAAISTLVKMTMLCAHTSF